MNNTHTQKQRRRQTDPRQASELLPFPSNPDPDQEALAPAWPLHRCFQRAPSPESCPLPPRVVPLPRVPTGLHAMA
eukprot:15481320-Alexandrium_andersonii.AAC.1